MRDKSVIDQWDRLKMYQLRVKQSRFSCSLVIGAGPWTFWRRLSSIIQPIQARSLWPSGVCTWWQGRVGVQNGMGRKCRECSRMTMPWMLLRKNIGRCHDLGRWGRWVGQQGTCSCAYMCRKGGNARDATEPSEMQANTILASFACNSTRARYCSTCSKLSWTRHLQASASLRANSVWASLSS